MMWNIRGLPNGISTAQECNAHKHEELHEQIKNYDAVVFLESGVSQEKKTPNIHDNFKVDTESKMKANPNSQYQHIGNGTAILRKFDI